MVICIVLFMMLTVDICAYTQRIVFTVYRGRRASLSAMCTLSSESYVMSESANGFSRAWLLLIHCDSEQTHWQTRRQAGYHTLLYSMLSLYAADTSFIYWYSGDISSRCGADLNAQQRRICLQNRRGSLLLYSRHRETPGMVNCRYAPGVADIRSGLNAFCLQHLIWSLVGIMYMALCLRHFYCPATMYLWGPKCNLPTHEALTGMLIVNYSVMCTISTCM